MASAAGQKPHVRAGKTSVAATAPATARAAFLVAPDGFARAEPAATDNRSMRDDADFDAGSADTTRGLLGYGPSSADPRRNSAVSGVTSMSPPPPRSW